MTTAPESDPYLLPLPTPASPVVLPHLAHPLHAHLSSCYADPVWQLAPLTANPSEPRSAIHWETWPAIFREEMRLAVWNLINGQLRPTFIQVRAARMRSRLSLNGTYCTTTVWRRFAAWLEEQGMLSLADCSPGVLHDYGQHLRDSGRGRVYVQQALVSLTRLWAFDQLSANPCGIGQPPWDEFGLDDYLPAATGSGGENAADPISEQTMGPLLIWAMRMVDELSGDILAGWAERQRLIEAARTSTRTPGSRAALQTFFRQLADTRAPLPTMIQRGRPAIARRYISGMTGATFSQVETAARGIPLAATEELLGSCPLAVPVTGRVGGRPWRPALDFCELPTLKRHLGTAAFIVCGYLTGMRPGEILGLRTGCCPEPAPGPDGRSGRHLIRGRVYKTARDEEGNHHSGGTDREVPWVAITPVVNAIRVLERMVPEGHLLFDHLAHGRHSSRLGTASLSLVSLRERIEDFIAWANGETVRHDLSGEIIPADPAGEIGTRRFRRSLAWHIARRPGGLVALAIQYGHLRTALGSAAEGYSSRSRDGIHELIDLETARAVADTVAAVHDDLDNGGGISGPAARRVIRAAAAAPRFAGTPITPASARKLLKNEDAVVYDNPHALVLCHYKRDRALCHRDGIRETPSLDRCVPGCGNIARTDQQAAELRERALALDTQASHVPQPVGDRLRATAARLREQADKHERTRITAAKDTE